VDVAGGKALHTYDGKPVPPAPGKSLAPAFARDNVVVHDYLWWLHEGSRAIRVGDWKLVAASPSLRGRGAEARQQEKPGSWELFNLADDRAETRNLADKMPEKVRELAAVWTQKQDEFFKLAKEGQ
jgi:arylsulfatase